MSTEPFEGGDDKGFSILLFLRNMNHDAGTVSLHGLDEIKGKPTLLLRLMSLYASIKLGIDTGAFRIGGFLVMTRPVTEEVRGCYFVSIAIGSIRTAPIVVL